MTDEAGVEKAGEEAAQAAALEAGRLLFAKECRFLTSAAALGGLPEADRPEVAFAGRSNVGKSSLVNALTGRKTLAKTSATPGRTRLLNFYSLAGSLYLVDLPGYGYARAPKTDVKRWTALTDAYLRGRPNLRRVHILIDARRGPMEVDLGVFDALDKAAVPYQIVLTKTDKLKAGELAAITAATAARVARRPAAHPEVLATSSAKGAGVAELRAAIAALASA